MSKLKLGFAGTPEFAASHLAALLETEFAPAAVFTQPDRKAGRGKKLTPSPVKKLALENNIPVYQPASLKLEDSQSLFKDLELDLLIVVAYGLILPTEILDAPKFGCINVHASLLPRWRGAAPIERAILAGDQESGVTIMQMDEGLDTGDMLHKVVVPISGQDTREDLENNLTKAGTQGLIYTLKNLQEILQKAQKQSDSEATYAAKLDKTEALVDFSLTANSISRVVRAGIGRNPAYAFLNGDRVRFLSATPCAAAYDSELGSIVEASGHGLTVACQDSSIIIETVQLPGKNPVSVSDVLNSKPDLFKKGVAFTMAEA